VLSTVYPAKFQQEPVDLAGFDRWQDWEGLQDATATCRDAWGGFEEQWRVVRRVELGREAARGRDARELTFADRDAIALASALGRAFGQTYRKGQFVRAVSEREREAYWAWRSRVLRADPDVWAMFWLWVGGLDARDVGAPYGVSPRYVVAACALAARWLADDLANCGKTARLAQ